MAGLGRVGAVGGLGLTALDHRLAPPCLNSSRDCKIRCRSRCDFGFRWARLHGPSTSIREFVQLSLLPKKYSKKYFDKYIKIKPSPFFEHVDMEKLAYLQQSVRKMMGSSNNLNGEKNSGNLLSKQDRRGWYSSMSLENNKLTFNSGACASGVG